MPNKRKERWYLEQLRTCLREFPIGQPEDGESPDFIVREGVRATGIELTEFHMPPAIGERPHQELQALKDRVVAVGCEHHLNAGGPALYVSVFFNNPARLSKGNATKIGQALSMVVLGAKVPTTFEDGAIQVPWNELPECIGDISIEASVDGCDRLWSADAGGWVAPIDAEHIQATVDGKGAMLRVARRKWSNVWLVIVHDDFGLAAPTELSESAVQSQYRHGFDRLIWLQPHTPQAFTLGRVG